jgi:putative transposase
LWWRFHQVRVSRETVRRWLHEANLVWRRRRPVLRRQDPQRAEKLEKLRQLLLHLPKNEIVLFEDEVDLNLNPKIGSMWMPRGQQAEVETPGDNKKC